MHAWIIAHIHIHYHYIVISQILVLIIYSWGTNRLDFSERLCQPISREEVAWALDKVKKDVAPGKVGVTAYMMSADVLFDVWCAFFEVCCGYGMVPSVWRESLVVPVPKK